jgi:hypothetical protein
MAIGKTSSSISIPELFDKYPEEQILTAVFPEITEIPCRISSPFRVDNHPSFSIFMGDDNHIRFKDFGDTDCKGGLLDLLCRKWNCSFYQVFDKILAVMQDKVESDVNFKPKQIKMLTRKESSELTKIQVAVRPWRDYDYEYWSSYGIEKQWLKYAGIHAISHKIITKEGKKYIFPAPKYSYVFTEYKDGRLSLKIYNPFDTKYKWCSKMDSSVWSLWTKIPEKGDNLIIGSSTKDCLNISCNLHIPAICMQGEGYWPKPRIIDELKSRYKNIIVFFDNDYTNEDNPGRTDSIKLANEFNLKRVEIPAKYEAKDPSDLFKVHGKEKYMEIMHEILDPVLWKDNN